ncbi:melanoma-associated antigen B16-like [Otolemur garnettii]|uniref:MAGE domain-containing protein n=1 Tax=Otolemur garnettii TaxID=30611 RepID=H0WV02_OTOGA|nr:melanoma-associated antigen B16-like [Otolemur garnettii]
MSRDQKIPQCTPDQHLQTQSETQGLESAQVPKPMEEALPSSSLLPMSDNLKEAPAAKVLSAPEGPQSFCSSSGDNTATSSSKPDDDSSSKEEKKSLSTSEATENPENTLIDALEKKVAFLVNFLLLKYRMEALVTKADILNIIIKDDEEHFSEIFLRASERMEMIFGLDVKEVDPTSHCYAIYIKLGLTYDGKLCPPEGLPKTGLLILMLGVIFMNDNCVSEEEVWRVLNITGIFSDQKHFIFGDPKEFITKDLVKEKYLEYRQVADSDPAQYEFLWGPRAHAEVRKMEILEFLAKVHGTDPKSYPSQYEDALRNEEERAQGRISVSAASTSMATESSSAMSDSISHT